MESNGKLLSGPFPDQGKCLTEITQPRSNFRASPWRHATHNPEVAANKARDANRKTNGQFEALTLDTAFPESVRALGENTYDRSKDALEAAVDAMEKSFADAAAKKAAMDYLARAQAAMDAQD
ncbi:MAG: hypothetical protein WA884_16310 [Methyloceanibacter sp.]